MNKKLYKWNPGTHIFNHTPKRLLPTNHAPTTFCDPNRSTPSINICAMNECMLKTHPLILQLKKLRPTGRNLSVVKVENPKWAPTTSDSAHSYLT